MTWVRFDDQYPLHRKIAGLTDRLYRLANEAVFWCVRNLTDGRIAADELRLIRSTATRRDADELVRRDIWHRADHACPNVNRCPLPGLDGWVIHDYFDYQPTREKVIAERTAKADRQARWLAARRAGKRPPKDGADASRDASHPPSIDASKDDALTQPPPRPEGKRGGGPEAPAARRGAAEPAGDGEHNHNPPVCPTCGNRIDSPYHRNTCRPEELSPA
jgi:hypothetical protein